MAISVNWITKVLTIPKSDTTLVSAGPPEIREYNVLDTFWVEVKAIEDDAEGMPFVHIVERVPAKLLGGVDFADIVEVVNGYTVTFEDGQYQINLIGANHNLSDVANPNSVGLRTANSAGLAVPTWTTAEKNQIRHRVGIDGTSDAPSATPSLSFHSAADVIDDLESRSYDGVPWPDTVKALLSFSAGDMIETKVSANVRRYDFYDRAGVGIVFTLTMNNADGTRVRS